MNQGFAVLIFVSIAGCVFQDSSRDDAAPTPSSTVTEQPRVDTHVEVTEGPTSQVVYDLNFSRVENVAAPRMAEMFIQYSANLAYLSSEPGEAVLDAEKQLIVQSRPNSLLRLVIFSAANTNTLDSGRLATLRFNVLTPGESRIEMLTEQQVFAPPDANGGLLISDPQVFQVAP